MNRHTSIIRIMQCLCVLHVALPVVDVKDPHLWIVQHVKLDISMIQSV